MGSSLGPHIFLKWPTSFKLTGLFVPMDLISGQNPGSKNYCLLPITGIVSGLLDLSHLTIMHLLIWTGLGSKSLYVAAGLQLSIASGAKCENFEQMAPKSKHWRIYWRQVISINDSLKI